MDRKAITLAALAASNGAVHTPVQVQKLLFLIDRQLGEWIGGNVFAFRPDAYGPLDLSVYAVLRELTDSGFVCVETGDHSMYRTYRATADGVRRGRDILSSLADAPADHIVQLSAWVRGRSFTGLVSAVNSAYPDMKARTVFQRRSPKGA